LAYPLGPWSVCSIFCVLMAKHLVGCLFFDLCEIIEMKIKNTKPIGISRKKFEELRKRQRAWGREQGAEGVEQRAWGRGHGAWEWGYIPLRHNPNQN
jgi:hypothetical protein